LIQKVAVFRVITGLFLCTILTDASFLLISEKDGTVVDHRNLKPQKNASLLQDSREYSLQAVYDALHREANLARAAQAAKKAVQKIRKIEEERKREGEVYALTSEDQESLLSYAKYFKGGRYRWGGTTPKGFDCSGYVQYLYKKYNIHLPRTALEQSKEGIPVERDALKKGDLLFFLTDEKRGIAVTHVGIYLGEGEFIHAASKKKGIIISPLDRGYYAEKFLFAKRILKEG